ncbi:MAG: hypothetical protein ACRCZL_03460 [Cetobacterium sp.]
MRLVQRVYSKEDGKKAKCTILVSENISFLEKVVNDLVKTCDTMEWTECIGKVGIENENLIVSWVIVD